jgi:integrase
MMAYIVAFWTGLRRSELQRLEWRDIRLDGQVPCIQLRAPSTKSGRDDVVPLHGEVVAELLAYKPAGAQPTDPVLRVVPSMGVLRRILFCLCALCRPG